jgi:methyl-accepting chemotaxis protein
MKFSKMKVGPRLSMGFGVLLLACLFLGGISWLRMSQLDKVMVKIATVDSEKLRLALEMQIRTRANASLLGQILMSEGDESRVESLRAEIKANTEKNSEAMARIETLVYLPEGKALLAEAAEARSAYTASRERVVTLAADSRTHAQALTLYSTETAKLLESYMATFAKLADLQHRLFDEAAAESNQTYASARNTIIISCIGVLIAGVLLALTLSRGIVRPLRRAVEVADAVRQGKLNNVIEVDSEDETGQLLGSLGSMQSALLARDQKDMDFRGQIDAINRAQAVIEFSMDGNVLVANDNFLNVTGYKRDEVVGKHHSMFAESSFANSAEYRAFWAKLNRGEFEAGTFKRIGKGGREIWMTASYSPIRDVEGKPFKVVKYATDVTEQMVKNADFAGQLEAIGRSQAVIEFDLDGTVRKINENFTQCTGYAPGEVVGKHHSQFVEPAYAASAEYRAFWAKLNRGDFEAGTFKRIGKGGREIWMTASYSPIRDANGKPFKVVKYASDVTPAMKMQQMLQIAVAQTQDAVQRAGEGDLTQRIPMEGKTGDLESLCRGVNSLLESTSDLVKRVKVATGEVQQGAEEISKGNINLSQRTEEQASSLEETASSMEEMTSTVKQTADNAGQANQLAMAARQQAEKGGAVVGNAVTAMSGINEASKKIADIIGVIDEIAFQTNLLALNAAVEAARAGEQGRGFAVVATEVRNLAGRSATAAKEIKTLIQDSVARVEQGSKLVDESGRTLEEIVNAVKKVTDIVAEIAAASREQSSGIEQVNRAVVQMDEMTQQNAALVEQATAASQSMAHQARDLNQMMMRYQVAEGAQGVQSAAPAARKPAAASAPAVKAERRSASRPWGGKGPRPAARTASDGESAAAASAQAAPRKMAASTAGDPEWQEF